MKLTEKELTFLNAALAKGALDGLFDFENNTEETFKNWYGLTMEDVDEVAISLKKKSGKN